MTDQILDQPGTCAPGGPTGPGEPPARVVVNPDDDVLLVRYLAAIHDPPAGRLVVLPTPALYRVSTSELARRTNLVSDVLLAHGKDLERPVKQRRVAEAWYDHAVAWLRGDATTDLIVDRAHLLSDKALLDFADLARRAGARLSLIWGARDSSPHLGNLLGLTPEIITPAQFWQELRPSRRRHPPAAKPWPALPTADFTTFLAVCRRRLPPPDFTRLERLYRRFYLRAARALNCSQWGWGGNTSAPSGDLMQEIVAHLRDDLIGPALTPQEALIRLRATQAAFLYRCALFLRWRPATLGIQPARRLMSDLTPQVSAVLRDQPQIDHAALVAIGLHLGADPGSGWNTARLGDLAADGSTLVLWPGEHLADPDSAWPTRPMTVVFPAHARPILAGFHALLTSRQAPADTPLIQLGPDSRVFRHAYEYLHQSLGLPADDHRPRISARAPASAWLERRALSIDLLPATFWAARRWEYTKPWWPSET